MEKKETYSCECIDCGHKIESESHCKDIKCTECGGTMRRAERPGPGQKKYLSNLWPDKLADPIEGTRREISTFGKNLFHAKAALGQDDDPGFIQGYFAKFDNIDLGYEVIRRGAFVKSIAERVPKNMVKLMVKHMAHGGDVLETIGTITEAKEDEYGGWFNAQLSKIETAQIARTLVLEGHINRCSVGYMPVKWNWITLGDYVDALTDGKMSQFEGLDRSMEILEHTECKLLEATLTVIPMNELAILTAAKSLDHAASRVRDIAKSLDAELGAEPLDDIRRAGILETVFGSEAEAKAFKDSIAALGGMDNLSAQVDRLLHPAASVVTDKTADDREFDMEQKRRRVSILSTEVLGGGDNSKC